MQGFYQILQKKEEKFRDCVMDDQQKGCLRKELQSLFHNTFHNDITPRMMYYFTKQQWAHFLRMFENIRMILEGVQELNVPKHAVTSLEKYKEECKKIADVYFWAYCSLSMPDYKERLDGDANMLCKLIDISRSQTGKMRKAALIDITCQYIPYYLLFVFDESIPPEHQNIEPTEELARKYISSLVTEYEWLLNFLKRGRAYFAGVGIPDETLDMGSSGNSFAEVNLMIKDLKEVLTFLEEDKGMTKMEITPTPTAK